MRAARHPDPVGRPDEADLKLLALGWSGLQDAVLLCRDDGKLLISNPAAAYLGAVPGADLANVLPGCDLDRLGERQSLPVFSIGDVVEAIVQPQRVAGARQIVVHRSSRNSETYALFQRLHSITSERRMTLEQRLDALFRLGAEHLGLARVVQTRIEGRHCVVERCVDPTGLVSIGHDVLLEGTHCDRTLRAAHPTALHEGEPGVSAGFAQGRAVAYLGAVVFVDAVRHGVLAFTQDLPRAPFTSEELLVVRLLAQWVGHELARDRDQRMYEQSQEELDQLARTDALTRLPNRRAVSEALHWQVAYVRRSGMPLSIVLADLDRFKTVNDRYGHDGGDAVLKAFADVCRAQKRETDVCGRWGGEEFLFLLPNTDAEGARCFSERLLQAVRDRVVTLNNGTRVHVTVSLGACTVWSTESDEAAIGRADRALYAAKDAGRDCVVLDDAGTPVPVPPRG